MSAGGVLGRLAQILAQWLRGLARRLDRAAGGAAVPGPVLAALAERFPGAPEHWLADIARHMIEANEPLPGVDSAVPPMETAPHEQRPPAPKPVQAERRTRPALRLIGSDGKRRPAVGAPKSAPQKRPAKLRWLGAAPKTISHPAWPELPASHRPQAAFETDTHEPAPESSAVPFEFRKAERLTNLPPASDRAATETPELPATHRFADRTFALSRDGSRRSQEVAFTASPPPTETDVPAATDFPAPVRIPVEFAQLRPAQRASLSFPQARRQPGGSAWSDTPGAWPALPPHQQDIDEAPAPASPLTDLVREQMSGRWSA